jgi:RhoGEF domain.
MDIVVQPMQRLTKYSLLLKAIYKNTENEEDQESLVLMVSELQTVSLWKIKLFHVHICQCIKITEPGEPGTALSVSLSHTHTHVCMQPDISVP